jgi:hypothetical protein
MVEGANSRMIYCNNFCKCHNVPIQLNNKKREYIHLEKENGPDRLKNRVPGLLSRLSKLFWMTL